MGHGVRNSASADLLVVGHRGRGGFASMQLGSVALRTVARAARPILVVRGAEHEARGLVLAALTWGILLRRSSVLPSPMRPIVEHD
jgi:hypothetical protein